MTLSGKGYLQVNQALFSLAHAYESRMAREEMHNTLGLRLSDCSVLMVLGQFAPLNSRRLSELMDVNPGTISVYVQRLVEMGLVEKEQDTQDRRNWQLTLTEAGQAAAQGIISGAVEYTRDFLAALDEAEQQTLHRLLLKAAHGLGFDWL
ncbi:MAG: MarR family transcriptional regulator [Thermoflexales bacterium]|nr:MarR family transcriptional regulator [Thermoflexales bacterium]